MTAASPDPEGTDVLEPTQAPGRPEDADVVERAYAPLTESAPGVPVDAAERRVLVIGEALVDVVHARDGAVTEHVGGSPANVALGLGRLGRGVDLLTWLGRDDRGHRITEHLAASGAALVPGSDGAGRTSVATARLSDDGSATYDFDLTWRIPETWASPPGPPIAVHTGSIAAVLEPGAGDVARILAAHRASATITYDPNLRPSLMPPPEQTRPVVERVVALADVVKVSDEDLAWLAPDDPLGLAQEWVTAGPALVVVTRGGQGAVAWSATGVRMEVPAPPVSVADTVGAGDSFMAGLVDGLWGAGLLGPDARSALRAIDEATLRSVLERCAVIAAITVSRPGANPPTAAEVAAYGA
ncbi:carbohydrate kinase family protein [Actinotalea fermentans]|uniref:Fructokinase n=1 Tax=Actinotalea fermentans TaxID=43671 RepID=A0A511YWR2_9CELL|nr:carbohydrate kinase [Actinotalea fermentans]KGM15870.1 ribokinase [Actinotalea fermentans ATCC 43279 = JCM 9966 = DSM 3133]GEN79653.1 fructokinase [Actinotalea fermentans]